MALRLGRSLAAAALLAMACQAAPGSAAPPARARSIDLGGEFALAPDESVEVTGASVRVRFTNVVSDRRCPRQVQCAITGPVTIELGVLEAGGEERLVKLAVLDRDVGGPALQGITSCVRIGKLALRLRDVQPWPIRGSATPRADYRASFVLASAC
jgi:hypothetical protein